MDESSNRRSAKCSAETREILAHARANAGLSAERAVDVALREVFAQRAEASDSRPDTEKEP